MSNHQGIPHKKIKIDLKQQKPTPLTIEALKEQLNNMGLNCEHTNEKRLRKYKEEVEARIPNGTNQAFGIDRPKVNTEETTYRSIYLNRDEYYEGLEEAAKGEWEPRGSALGYMTELSTVIFPSHFQYLLDNKQGFTGQKSDEYTENQRLATVDAVKNMFVQVGIEASASLIKGIDKVSLDSILSNAIAPLNEHKANDYDESDSRVIYLVENYDPNTGEAEAIGVLGIDWRLRITNFKEKKTEPLHETCLEITTRSVLYDNIETLKADVLFIDSHLQDSMFTFIPPRGSVKIFDKLPPANNDTFLHGLPVISKNDYVEVIILYAPNLENLGSIDNSNSSATSSYSKTVESGFTFTMEQRIAVGAEFEAGVVFAKGKFSISMELSFTEQWNQSQSETIEFSTPGQQKCFMYQGYLLSRKLRYYPEDRRYDYFSQEGRFLTDIIKTSEVPIMGNPKDTQEILREEPPLTVDPVLN